MSRRDGMIVHCRVGHTPCGKQGYSSRKAAKRALNTSPTLVGKKGIRAYRCPNCSLWHVGHLHRSVISGYFARKDVYR